jgi:hypothetical protein
MIPVDVSVEWQKMKFGAGPNVFLMLFIIVTYLSHLNTWNNIVSNYISN